MLSLKVVMIKNIIENIANGCRGKNAFVRMPFLIWFAYVFMRHLKDPMYSGILGALNFGIHELGHPVFSIFGSFMGAAGGTIAQLLAPVYGMFNFIKQRDYFSVALCFGWLATNFYGVADYASDARSMCIPLVSPFGADASHDWNNMLSRMNLLPYDISIGNFFSACGFLSMIICLIGGGWVIMLMLRNTEQK